MYIHRDHYPIFKDTGTMSVTVPQTTTLTLSPTSSSIVASTRLQSEGLTVSTSSNSIVVISTRQTSFIDSTIRILPTTASTENPIAQSPTPSSTPSLSPDIPMPPIPVTSTTSMSTGPGVQSLTTVIATMPPDQGGNISSQSTNTGLIVGLVFIFIALIVLAAIFVLLLIIFLRKRNEDQRKGDGNKTCSDNNYYGFVSHKHTTIHNMFTGNTRLWFIQANPGTAETSLEGDSVFNLIAENRQGYGTSQLATIIVIFCLMMIDNNRLRSLYYHLKLCLLWSICRSEKLNTRLSGGATWTTSIHCT